MAAEVTQILVRPSRADLAVEAGLRMIAIPTQPEAVAVGAGGRFKRLNALRNQGMRRLGHVMFERRGYPAICDPAAHRAAFAYAFARVTPLMWRRESSVSPFAGQFRRLRVDFQ